VEGEEVGRRARQPRRVVPAPRAVLQETLHEAAAAAGSVGPADPRRGKGAAHRVHGVVVELVELLGRGVPVRRAVGLVPHLPEPGLDLGAPVARHAVAHPLVDQLRPLAVVGRRVGPAGADRIVLEARPPFVLVGKGPDREGLGHESDLGVGAHTPGSVGVEDPVQDGPVVHGPPGRVLRVGVGAAPLERRRPVARAEKVVGPEVNGAGPQLAELGKEPAAVLHRGVVRLVGPEEAPDGRHPARGAGGVDLYRDGKRGGGGGRARMRRQAGKQAKKGQACGGGGRRHAGDSGGAAFIIRGAAAEATLPVLDRYMNLANACPAAGPQWHAPR
jgi:hypothetical protein